MNTIRRLLLRSLAVAACACTAFAQPSGERPPGRKGGPGPRGSGYSIGARTVPKNEREQAILSVIEDIGRGTMSVPTDDGRLLRVLAEGIGAKHIVEIGTSVGASSLWFCLALEPTRGKLTTFEIDEGRAATARSNFKRAGVENTVTLILGDAHQEVTKITEPVDLLFIDADKEGYADYLQKLLPRIRAGGLVVAHNIDARQADPTFVKAITTNPELETILVNMGASGVSVSLKKR